MLVHKKTLGVLYYMWNASGTRIVPGTFRNYPEAKSSEWWEVKNESKLAARIALCYPDFIPITDESNRLIDIRDLRAIERKEKREREQKELIAEMKRIAKEKGYERSFNIGQRANLLYFLSDALDKAGKKKGTGKQKENSALKRKN